MKAIVKDIEKEDYTYCILTCIDMPVEKLQAKIDNIIRHYATPEWTYAEVLDALPKEWNVEYEQYDVKTVYV